MATAEQLLNEAQYAFANISFGESFANTRHAARAKSLCRKIIRKFPATMEAGEARAILKRLGEEAYTSEMPTPWAARRFVPLKTPRAYSRSRKLRANISAPI